MYNPDNVFYKIIHGLLPTKLIEETTHSLCIIDINPQAKTHLLIMPKGSYTDYVDFYNRATKAEIDDINELLCEIDSTVPNNTKITNMGSYQEIKHFHWHVLSDDAMVFKKQISYGYNRKNYMYEMLLYNSGNFIYENAYTVCIPGDLDTTHYRIIARGEYVNYTHLYSYFNELISFMFRDILHTVISKLKNYKIVMHSGTRAEVPHCYVDVLSKDAIR